MNGRKGPVVYDPNEMNGYGLELAECLRLGGFRPVVYSAKIDMGVVEFVVYPIKGVPGNASGRFRDILGKVKRSLLRGVLAVRLAATTPPATPIIVVWTRGLADALAFSARALLCRNVFVIFHNPTPERRDRGVRGIALNVLLRTAKVCVHSEYLQHVAAQSGLLTSVVPHPPYALFKAWTADSSEIVPQPNPQGVAIVGALRWDKGIDQLSLIARESVTRWDLVVAGAGRLPKEVEEGVVASGRHVRYPPGRDVGDSQLAVILRSSAVILAPYTAVTESGTLALGNTLDIPALALESPAAALRLNDASVATSIRALASLLDKFLASPWTTYSVAADELGPRCEERWRVLLND